jgi:serine/threonine-protein kinase
VNLAPGTALLQYRLVEKIGEGGMGEVWRAADATLSRDVALKFLPESLSADPERLARFEREAKLLASLNNPGVAAIFGLHEHEGIRFLAMELVPGEDLAQRLARGPIAVADAIDLARQIAEALESAHDQGIVHRDLKPGNILVGADGRPKLLDFGTAKLLNPADPAGASRFTQQGFRAFTPEYASTEQILGGVVTAASDVYSLGVICYRLLTGRQPYRFSSYANEEFINPITNYQPARPSTSLTGGAGLANAAMLPFDPGKVASACC